VRLTLKELFCNKFCLSYSKLVALKILTSVFLFISFGTVTSGQVIKGSVLDKDTKSPIGFAYLYFSGTFAGTQSNPDGSFELNVAKKTSIPLTVSAIGYYSVTLTDYLDKKPVTVYLVPKVYELNEVSVGGKSLARQRKANLTLFKDEFLGVTANAQNCLILNEPDITFNYASDKDTLKAFASKPLNIENRALGYKITYYLDKFEYIRSTKSFFFKGNMIFTEDLNKGDDQEKVFSRKRKFAYLGSRMHFFRALWYNDLKSTGFSIKNTSNKDLSYKDIVYQDAGNNKYLMHHENLYIYYYSKEPLSTLEFLKEKVYFANDGYFDPSGIAWDGKMASLRIADWLPYEYSVEEK
jgi:hypothetical protein